MRFGLVVLFFMFPALAEEAAISCACEYNMGAVQVEVIQDRSLEKKAALKLCDQKITHVLQAAGNLRTEIASHTVPPVSPGLYDCKARAKNRAIGFGHTKLDRKTNVKRACYHMMKNLLHYSRGDGDYFDVLALDASLKDCESLMY